MNFVLYNVFKTRTHDDEQWKIKQIFELESEKKLKFAWNHNKRLNKHTTCQQRKKKFTNI